MAEQIPGPSFARACGALARQHPVKVMAIVGSVFFVAGIAARSVISRPPAVVQTAGIPAPPASVENAHASSPAVPTTTATAPAQSHCDRQTWPYLYETCRDALATKAKTNPPIRVVAPEREAPNTAIAATPSGRDASASAAAEGPEPETAASAPPPDIKDTPNSLTAAEQQPAAKPKAPKAAPTASDETVAPGAAQTAAKAKPKRERKQRRKEEDNGETVLVRDTVRYPDGRQYSVTRRVKKDDQFVGEDQESRRAARVEENDEDGQDEDFDAPPRRSDGLFWQMRD